ncbi:hypothetical protein ACF0H5_017651 [Mactra antiquata]
MFQVNVNFEVHVCMPEIYDECIMKCDCCLCVNWNELSNHVFEMCVTDEKMTVFQCKSCVWPFVKNCLFSVLQRISLFQFDSCTHKFVKDLNSSLQLSYGNQFVFDLDISFEITISYMYNCSFWLICENQLNDDLIIIINSLLVRFCSIKNESQFNSCINASQNGSTENKQFYRNGLILWNECILYPSCCYSQTLLVNYSSANLHMYAILSLKCCLLFKTPYTDLGYTVWTWIRKIL